MGKTDPPHTVRRTLTIGVVLAISTLGGCGNDAKKTPRSETPSTAKRESLPKTPASTETVAKGPFSQVKQRLSRAGYSFEDEEMSQEPVVASLQVKVPELRLVHVVAYASSADAAVELEKIRQALKSTPKRLATQRVGKTVYWAGQPNNFTSTEKKAFEEVVATAEGRR